MKYSINGLKITQSFEGYRSTAYQDTGGVWTIGYGHTAGVKEGDVCTQLQAEEWLRQDISKSENCVNQNVKAEINQQEFDAFVDFVFNVGCGNFMHSTLLMKLNAGYTAAAANEFENWKYNHGKVLAGLLRRRIAEEQEFKQDIT